MIVKPSFMNIQQLVKKIFTGTQIQAKVIPHISFPLESKESQLKVSYSDWD
jgi:hypothetical protein